MCNENENEGESESESSGASDNPIVGPQMFLDEHFPDVDSESALGILTEAPTRNNGGQVAEMEEVEEVDEPDEVFIRNLIARCQERPNDPEMIQYKDMIYLAARKIGVPIPKS